MKSPSNVKSFPKFFSRFFLTKNIGGITLYPNIFLNHEIYIDLQRDKQNPKYIALLNHEQEHLKRQREMEPSKFFIKYALFPRFRFREEIIANKKTAEVLKKYGIPFDSNFYAKYLSGPIYLWCVSYKEAKEELDKLI
jgi:hypothetical protein